MTPFPVPRGRWFNEFETGQSIVTAGRTITEADIVNFAGLSGDFNSVHMDADFAQSTDFGRRPAQGLLVVSIVSGLLVQTGLLDGTLGAFREITKWKFQHPVYIGDTIRAEMEIVETRALKGMTAGLVGIFLNVKNQDNLLVMSGKWTTLVLGRSG